MDAGTIACIVLATVSVGLLTFLGWQISRPQKHIHDAPRTAPSKPAKTKKQNAPRTKSKPKPKAQPKSQPKRKRNRKRR